MTDTAQPEAAVIVGLPERIRILTICEKGSEAELLTSVLGKAGLTSESTNNLMAGCESVNPGGFRWYFALPFCRTGRGSA